MEQCHFLHGCEKSGPEVQVEMCWIGVPSEPDRFVERALKAGHPRGLDVHIDDAMKSIIQMNLVDPPFDLAKRRVEYLKKWTSRAKELTSAEEQLRRGMPEHVREVLGRKRFVLFGEMLADLGYPDDKLVEDIASGFKVSGYMQKSNVFRSKSKRPVMSLEALRKLGKSFNARNAESLSRRQESELEEATWAETEAELKRGWIFLDSDRSMKASLLAADSASARVPRFV